MTYCSMISIIEWQLDLSIVPPYNNGLLWKKIIRLIIKDFKKVNIYVWNLIVFFVSVEVRNKLLWISETSA